mmetsp:Transcript_32089/g.88670  ORF Transcript_32089/g.88670 Transcript_32089/m.88670 type:complete len:283 (+) Transcript_32089:244-1092(+)
MPSKRPRALSSRPPRAGDRIACSRHLSNSACKASISHCAKLSPNMPAAAGETREPPSSSKRRLPQTPCRMPMHNSDAIGVRTTSGRGAVSSGASVLSSSGVGGTLASPGSEAAPKDVVVVVSSGAGGALASAGCGTVLVTAGVVVSSAKTSQRSKRPFTRSSSLRRPWRSWQAQPIASMSSLALAQLGFAPAAGAASGVRSSCQLALRTARRSFSTGEPRANVDRPAGPQGDKHAAMLERLARAAAAPSEPRAPTVGWSGDAVAATAFGPLGAQDRAVETEA